MTRRKPCAGFLGPALALAATLAIGGCRSPEPARPAPAGIGDPAYQTVVSRSDLNGAPIGHDGKATATVVIVFASWCYPCRQELGLLSELIQEYPSLRVVGVNAFEDFDDLSDVAKLKEFLGANHPWLRVVRADDQILRSLGGVRKIPTLFVFDSHGAAVKVFRRSERTPPTKEELSQLLGQLHG